jgi:DNA-binding LytR/AlgR family response regulator
MKYIIIEDEKIAADRLRNLISELRPDYRHLLRIDSVESASISLKALQPDVIFMDIQLADGLSFDIFDQVQIETPIIFTTAYDQYAIQAFKTNSIDYLLKPIDKKELESAIEKFEKHIHSDPQEQVIQITQSLKPEGKERFVVRVGEHLKSIKTEDIKLFYSQDKTTYLFTTENRRFPLDYTIEKLEMLVSSQNFNKISRKFIINIEHIKDIIAFTNSRLEIKVDGFDDEQIIVAREKVNEFKAWLDR